MNWSVVSNQEAKSFFFKWPRLETPQLFCNTWQRGSCGQTKTEAEHNHDYGRRNPSYHEIFFGVDKVISDSHNCASASPQFHSKLLCSLNKLQSWLFQWSHQPQLQILSSPLITLWSLFTVARFPSTTYCIAHYIILFEFLARTSYIHMYLHFSEWNKLILFHFISMAFSASGLAVSLTRLKSIKVSYWNININVKLSNIRRFILNFIDRNQF